MTNTHQADTLGIAVRMCWEFDQEGDIAAIWFEPEEEGQVIPAGLMDALEKWAGTEQAREFVKSRTIHDPAGDEDDRLYHEGVDQGRTAHV